MRIVKAIGVLIATCFILTIGQVLLAFLGRSAAVAPPTVVDDDPGVEVDL